MVELVDRQLSAASPVVEVGEEVTLFGPGDHGEPTAAEWAGWCDTIGYEIVTRIGSRVPRVYLRRSASGDSAAAEGEGG